MFISILYMFRATMCLSSGEITASIRHLVFVTLCRWPSDMQGGSSTQSDEYQVSYWYSYFFWWWALSCPKHVENRNKHTKKYLCIRLVSFKRLYKDARLTKHKKRYFLSGRLQSIWLADLNCDIVAFCIEVFKKTERTKLDTVFPRSL
jgi:hypothetical protein